MQLAAEAATRSANDDLDQRYVFVIDRKYQVVELGGCDLI
jgi:hypothetical protein